MMVEEKHYDDDSLIALASEPVALDEHLASCTDCSERLETFRLIAEAMADQATWDTRPLPEAPVPETIANLRGFADRMAVEDTEAAQLLPDLIIGAREQWMSTLHHHPEYRTAGMVRKLLEAVPTALDIMPRDAVELTALAIEIADNLQTATSQLRGAAWRERAYALFYTGDYVNAEKALCASERHFAESAVNEYDLARVGVVRALVERGLERYTSAASSAQCSARSFAAHRDRLRSAAARLAQAQAFLGLEDVKGAIAILLQLKREFEHTDDSDTYARILNNLGYCYARLRHPDEALLYHDAAAKIFTEIGAHSAAVRERWNVARVLMGEGRFDEAMHRQEVLRQEFERLGMIASYAQVTLELAEILITRADFRSAEDLCSSVMRILERSELQHTAPALTAVALMQEAARNRTATPQMAVRVREYLKRVPNEPHLLFAFTE